MHMTKLMLRDYVETEAAPNPIRNKRTIRFQLELLFFHQKKEHKPLTIQRLKMLTIIMLA